MSTISSVGGSSALSNISQITTRSTQSTEAGSKSGDSKLSKMGELMSQLQELKESDPEKAKAVLSKISEGLAAKADTLGDPKMKELADKFAEAAKSGDLSGLKPKGPPPGGRPPGPPPEAGGGTASKQLAVYAQNGSDPIAEIESIISSALSTN